MDLFELPGHRGSLRSAGVGNSIAGNPADGAIIDDPFGKREDADSPTMRQKVWDWYASGGAGYFLSRKAATIVAEMLAITHWAEDVHVGNALRAAGIPLSIEPRLVPFASMGHRPRRVNDLITLHACTAAWEASHTETGLYAASG